MSALVKAGAVILADKGYVSEPLAEKLKAQGQTLLALKRNNALKPYPLSLERYSVGGGASKPLFRNWPNK